MAPSLPKIGHLPFWFVTSNPGTAIKGWVLTYGSTSDVPCCRLSRDNTSPGRSDPNGDVSGSRYVIYVSSPPLRTLSNIAIHCIVGCTEAPGRHFSHHPPRGRGQLTYGCNVCGCVPRIACQHVSRAFKATTRAPSKSYGRTAQKEEMLCAGASPRGGAGCPRRYCERCEMRIHLTVGARVCGSLENLVLRKLPLIVCRRAGVNEQITAYHFTYQTYHFSDKSLHWHLHLQRI